MYKQFSYEGRELRIKLIDNLLIEGTVLDDSQVDYMLIQPTNFDSDPIELMRQEIHLIDEV